MPAPAVGSATTIVFVHGNPETAAIRDHLADRRAEAGRTDQLRLSPPGFGSGVPVGFESTPVGYCNWLTPELEKVGRPVDLVGHDWGGVNVVNLSMARPDLLRSWASAAIGIFDPGYVWHPLAQLWMTPGEGEQWVAELLASSFEQRTAVLAVIATGDPNAATLEQRRSSAARAGAQSVDLEGFGHWWLTEDRGQRGAEALDRFWAQL